VTRQTGMLSIAALVVSGAILQADTLVLRDGRRVQGELVAVRDGVIEFDGQRGPFGRERIRIDRDDIVRIEFDGSGNRFDNERDRNRDRNDQGGSRPSGMRERDVTVDAAQAWTDSGVSVRAGQTVYFEATGRVRWGPGRQDGPAGEKNSPRNAGRPMPGRPAGSLIGRIGDTDEYFFIGDDAGPVRLRGGGRLFLGVNDDYLQDNSGSFRVTVYY
jgi:hypothetical protein